MKRVSSLVLAATVLVVAACSDNTATAPIDDSSPALNSASNGVDASEAQDVQPIADEYIVVFKSNVSDAPGQAKKLAAQEGLSVKHAYGKALKGFSAHMSASTAAKLKNNSMVDFVEQDQVVTADATQAGATWGIDRIDQRNLPLSTTYNYTSTGAGVTAYIIDTGIQPTHPEFGGRAFVLGDQVADGQNGIDCNGHGTHVAGTVGGATYGVAKGVTIKAMRVLSCSGSGSTSGVIAGIDAVALDHQAGAPAVANMSLGGGFSQALNNAVNNAILDGVTFAVAAGNGNSAGVPLDACSTSPASTPNAITVGATTAADHEAYFSNYGKCVDILAPGVGITSAWLSNGYNTISGTSMATPHVAGVAARYLQNNPGATPAQVRSFIGAQAASGVLTLNNARKKIGTPNSLLNILPSL